MDTNLVSGFLGALIGFAGALFLYLVQRNHSERGATRAVLAEVQANRTALGRVLEKVGDLPVSDALFRAHAATIAARLSREDMKAVADAYMFVSPCERIRLEAAAGDAIGDWETRMLVAAKDHFEDVTDVLTRRS